MLIPNGTIVTYQGRWNSAYFSGPASVINAVIAALAGDGLATRNFSTDAGLLADITHGAYSVTLQLQVENGLGYGSENDIISIVAGRVQQISGDPPYSSSIPFIQAPGGAPLTTGQPVSAGGGGSGSCSGSLDSSGSWSFACWIANLTSNAMWAVGLVGLGIVAAIFLINAPRKA